MAKESLSRYALAPWGMQPNIPFVNFLEFSLITLTLYHLFSVTLRDFDLRQMRELASDEWLFHLIV